MFQLRRTLSALWSAETARGRGWTQARPSTGQCAVTALLVQDLFGGELRRVPVDADGHYYGHIDGRPVDITEDQFDQPPNYTRAEPADRERLLHDADTARRYRLLRERFDTVADAVLPVAEQQHLAIRDPNYVAGSRERPEVAIFSQSRTNCVPLPDHRMSPGQRIWMKWTGGPIVAASSVLSWHTARYRAGNVNEVRNLALGTRLFGLNDYWNQVQDKGEGWVSVVRLRDEQWLDVPIHSHERSRGSSWMYLDTLRKQILWLSRSWEAPPEPREVTRTIPAGLRFRVLRRDGYTCRYCGARAPEVPLHVDHVVPWVEVRCHEEYNLVTACEACNLGKSAQKLSGDQIASIHESNRARP